MTPSMKTLDLCWNPELNPELITKPVLPNIENLILTLVAENFVSSFL